MDYTQYMNQKLHQSNTRTATVSVLHATSVCTQQYTVSIHARSRCQMPSLSAVFIQQKSAVVEYVDIIKFFRLIY